MRRERGRTSAESPFHATPAARNRRRRSGMMMTTMVMPAAFGTRVSGGGFFFRVTAKVVAVPMIIFQFLE